MHYLETGIFVLTRVELKKTVSDEDRLMLTMSKLPDDYDFDTAFNSVFTWCQNAFIRMDQIR